MLVIPKNKSQTPQKCQPNILPCRVRHNGPVDASKRYWNPSDEVDGSRTSYFRGRKLQGNVVEVPDGYKGVILEKTGQIVPQSISAEGEGSVDAEHDEGEDDANEECRSMEEVASFERMVVWGHECKPDQEEDPYSKGVNQWINLAQAIHSYNAPAVGDATTAPAS